MSAYVEIFRADGSSERFPLEGEEAVLGRSANVAISMPGENDLDLEHALLIDRGKAGCWVASAERVVNPLLRGGKVFESGMVPWGTEFQIGSLRVVLGHAKGKKGFSLNIDPKVIVTIVFAVGALGWFQYQQSQKRSAANAPIAPPELFEEAEATCPQGEAGANAERAEHLAVSWAQRYAYDPGDGVRAVQKYREAAACHRAIGQESTAQRLSSNATQLQDRIEHDYRSALTRLPRWLTASRWEEALVEAQRLLALTKYADQEHRYIKWIKRKQRETSAKVARGK